MAVAPTLSPLTLLKYTVAVSSCCAPEHFNCAESLLKVKFSTDQVRDPLVSGSCLLLFVTMLKNLKTALFRPFQPNTQNMIYALFLNLWAKKVFVFLNALLHGGYCKLY